MSSKVLHFNKRTPPIAEPSWRTYQRQNYIQKVKPIVDEIFEEEMRKYRALMAQGRTSVKKPERISILNRVAKEVYSTAELEEEDAVQKVQKESAQKRVATSSHPGNSRKTSVAE